MKKRLIVKLLIIFLLVLIISLPSVISWGKVLYIYMGDWWFAYENREPSLGQMKQYYESLSQPKLTSQQVIDEMKKQKGLLDNNTELIREVEWYAYHSNKRVIKQLVSNLVFEVDVTLPEEKQASTFICINNTKGKSLNILFNKFGLLQGISPVLHEELWRHAKNKNEPHLIHLIMRAIASNDKLIEKPDNDPDYNEGGGVYYDIAWFHSDLVCQDILAYLRIYTNYKSWPTLREDVVSHFHHYPGEWIDSKIMREILVVADKEGVESSYALFNEWFKKEHDYQLNETRDSPN